MADRKIWIPPTGGNSVRSVANSLPTDLPYERTSTPEPSAPLLIVASSPVHLAAVRDMAEDHDVVVWAWRLPEIIAQRFEDHHPVVYGNSITAAEVEAAATDVGAGRQPRTTLLADLESLFGFPQEV